MIEYINDQKFDAVIGLGDIECPQFLNNFYGILGEFESVFVMKYLKKTNRLIQTSIYGLSVNFSDKIVITHFPPKGFGTGIIGNFMIGNEETTKKILHNKPKIVLHGHSEYPSISEKNGIKIISIGSLYNGFYTEYYPDNVEFVFKRAAIKYASSPSA
ncbi:metallophosphoesterase family protein [Acidianus brierleyi]|uniref:metallophosphoesterase family protein n=1 Tax=Acidianus brierleyi TaxID=41673 RepID=UPI001FE6CCF3|nr:metallophosphoesterase family protein [Acidianus brierleyi]